MRQNIIFVSTLIALLLFFGTLAFPFPLMAEAQSPPVARLFSPPLGYRDGVEYGPRITYDNSGMLIENTNYGIRNPDLQGNTCFGVDFSMLFHAGEDWYREDGNSTQGAEVTAVADGKVVFSDPINYPGRVVIIEHVLPSGEKVYSMYAHIENLAVSNGQIVSRGQRLGTVMYQPYNGRYPEYHPSGDDSHLHFEIRYFYDGSNIYDDYPACNGIIPGRGYTYPEHPDDFPTPGAGYTDPATFVKNRQGSFLPAILKNYALCTEGTSLIQNGGFEDGPSRWIEGSSIIRSTSDPYPPPSVYEGEWAAWLGGYNNANDRLYQYFTVPVNLDFLALSYYVWVGTDETSGQWDYLYVTLRDENNAILSSDQLDNSTLPEHTWVRREQTIYGLGSLAGQQLHLMFQAITDGSNITSFVVDNVSLVEHCGAGTSALSAGPVVSTPIHQSSPIRSISK
jgi:hypothetical protein